VWRCRNGRRRCRGTYGRLLKRWSIGYLPSPPTGLADGFGRKPALPRRCGFTPVAAPWVPGSRARHDSAGPLRCRRMATRVPESGRVTLAHLRKPEVHPGPESATWRPAESPAAPPRSARSDHPDAGEDGRDPQTATGECVMRAVRLGVAVVVVLGIGAVAWTSALQ